MTHASFVQHFTVMRHMHALYRLMQRVWRHWSTDDLSAVSQSMELEETRLPRLLKLTIITLSAATGLFIIWAAITPVKELARTEGQVLPSGYSQVVQHLEGGLVREILVHEGDFVQKGQLLVQLDGAGLEEDSREQSALVEALSLQAERLHAMLENREPDFSGIEASPEAIAEQTRMYETMQQAHQSELSVIDEQISQKKLMISRLQESLGMAQNNLNVSRESKNIYANLNEKGLTSRTAYLKKQEELNTSQESVNNIEQQIKEAQTSLQEFMRRREALSAQQRDTAYTELHKVETDLAQGMQNLKKRNDRVTRLDVRAPVMGYVKGLKLNTVGSVIPAGQTLMEIVPVDEQLIVEVRILPQQIGRVAVGQKVQVKVDSYDYVRFGAIEGKLESISAMTFSDEIRRQDYYKGRVRLTRNYSGSIPGQHLILPGMTVDADIVTGQKSILSYLLKPIHTAMQNAMTEQ